MTPTATPKWTDAQRRGIETTGRSLLLSAAAGSGKTAVLAERCAYLVGDARPPCRVDQLLVVTFTEAAAAEMKSRIQQALHKRLDRGHSEHLARQLALINHAQISTLHQFCARIVRQHFHLLQLDPHFAILDEDEARLLRLETVRGLFDEQYESDESGQFQKLIDHYGDGNDQQLMQHIVRTHALLCSLIDPKQWLEQALWRLREVGDRLMETALGRELFRVIDRRLLALHEQCGKAEAAVAAMNGFAGYAAYLKDLRRVLEHWRLVFAEHGPDALAEVAAIEFPRLPTIRGNSEAKTVALALLESVRKPMKEGSLRDMLTYTEAQWREGVQSTLPCAEVFLRLVLDFSKRYAAAKQALHSLDFSDLERFALRVLRDSGLAELAPSAVARQYQKQFEHVLVDEYQDINEVQDAILTLVSRESGNGQKASASRAEGPRHGNLFCVGDVKQSIYRFRLAEPARFLDREARFRGGGDGAGEVIDLQQNFRSRGPLLGAINHVFQRLMTREAAEIEYDQTHHLHPGLDYPGGDEDCFSGAPIELHLLPDELDGDEQTPDEVVDLERTGREAAFVARRIRAMMGMDGCPRMQVCEKSASGLVLRPIRYSDMVVLLRALAHKADQYAEVLRQHGIPVHSESGTGYFESMEVRDMLALLQVLENQRQDIPLAAVLRNPVLGIERPDDGLARIATAYCRRKEIAFHEAVVRYAGEREDELALSLRAFLQRLHEWRTAAQLRPVADLLWQIYDETGYLAFCAGLHNGGQRQANLIHLHQRARQFGTFQRQDLSRFLSFLQSLRAEYDLGQPSVATAAEDVVRIMSVHRSKGLEFPVVLLPDLGKRFNLSDCAGSILVDRHAGLGMAVVDEAKRIRYPSLAQTLVKQRLLEQNLAEELRVLYVAMTRAREHLVLLGTCGPNKLENWTAQWAAHDGPLPAEQVLGARCPLDWLGPVAAALESAGRSVQVQSHDAESVRRIIAALPAAAAPQTQPLAIAAAPAAPTPEARQLIDRLTWSYPHAALAQVRAAESVTGWTKNGPAAPLGYDVESVAKIPPRMRLDEPAFMRDSGASAAEIGSATHLVLEHLDFAAPCDGSGLRRQVNLLVERKIITAAQADTVDFDALGWFVDSEVGRLLRRCAGAGGGGLLRELPFNLAVPAGEGDEGLDRIMVRGRIDVLVPVEDGFALVDYKTDRVTAQQVPQRAELYAPQVRLYGQAVRTILRRPLRATHLVFLSPRMVWTTPMQSAAAL